MITVISDGSVSDCGKAIQKSLENKGANSVHLPLDKAVLKPCLGCGGCETKTYKRCVFRDDGDRILPYIAQSDTLVIITPVVFGGYSYQTKLVVDKLALLGDHHYFMNKGELVKGKESDTRYFAIGISDGCGEKEARAFEYLVNENLNITGWRGKAILLKSDCDANAIAGEVLGS